jgi:hypothetical protein
MLSAVVLLLVTCGTERWDVKVMKDQAAAQVDVAHPHEATVAQLREFDAPRYSDANARSAVEKKVYFVTAYVLGYKQEKGDGDFHLVIADDPNGAAGTMIAELPAPECLDPSPAAERMKTAREAFTAMVQDKPPSEKYRVLRRPLRVSITGVAFFDRLHRQKGVAPNGIELHPVLALGKAQ